MFLNKNWKLSCCNIQFYVVKVIWQCILLGYTCKEVDNMYYERLELTIVPTGCNVTLLEVPLIWDKHEGFTVVDWNFHLIIQRVRIFIFRYFQKHPTKTSPETSAKYTNSILYFNAQTRLKFNLQYLPCTIYLIIQFINHKNNFGKLWYFQVIVMFRDHNSFKKN